MDGDGASSNDDNDDVQVNNVVNKQQRMTSLFIYNNSYWRREIRVPRHR
jgi:hypothetical protein